MSFQNPGFRISRQSVAGREGEWVKHFDPPTESPQTPERINPTNPVPEVMANAGLQDRVRRPNTVQRDLMHGRLIGMWDGKPVWFYLFRDRDNPVTGNGNFPGATIRVPRGAIFHGETEGHGPPPHTIHWHGIEPTSINDGVGHCSMEIGDYTYQLQPNHIGTYFYHCHRNTVMHMEFGLYGLMIIDPPDAFFATQENPAIPIGAGRDGLRRTAANVGLIAPRGRDPFQFPGFNSSPLASGDPHAFTVPYDVEAFWVLDDRDSRWSDMTTLIDPITLEAGPDADATLPVSGNQPGVDDDFRANVNPTSGFFAFNDFRPDYFFVTGQNVAAPAGSTGTIPANLTIDPRLNSGVLGTQISINARLGQTILIRCLDAAYVNTRVRFPVDVAIIAFDGRALGVPPFGQYNRPYVLKANTPIELATAMRFDALTRVTTPVNSFATVEYLDTRGGDLLFTARIPFVVS